jgi:hypothetical protein
MQVQGGKKIVIPEINNGPTKVLEDIEEDIEKSRWLKISQQITNQFSNKLPIKKIIEKSI